VEDNVQLLREDESKPEINQNGSRTKKTIIGGSLLLMFSVLVVLMYNGTLGGTSFTASKVGASFQRAPTLASSNFPAPHVDPMDPICINKFTSFATTLKSEFNIDVSTNAKVIASFTDACSPVSTMPMGGSMSYSYNKVDFKAATVMKNTGNSAQMDVVTFSMDYGPTSVPPTGPLELMMSIPTVFSSVPAVSAPVPAVPEAPVPAVPEAPMEPMAPAPMEPMAPAPMEPKGKKGKSSKY
jgi:hypothetical protein